MATMRKRKMHQWVRRENDVRYEKTMSPPLGFVLLERGYFVYEMYLKGGMTRHRGKG